jgi:branched-chain amino acid transport system substrate-binding protein
VGDYRKKYGKVPSYFAETCYTSALDQRGGEAGRRQRGGAQKFMAAFRRSRSPTRRAAGEARPVGKPIQNIYVRKVERKGGELQNTVIHTFPAVSQFWTTSRRNS